MKKCIQEGKTLEMLSLEEYRQASELIEEDVYTHIDLGTCVSKRVSEGGTSVESVEKQIAAVRYAINAFVDGAPQFDDNTMLCIRYNGAAQ